MGGQQQATYRCIHCPPDRILYSTSDVRGRRGEVMRTVAALVAAAARDHLALFGHDLEVVESVKVNA